MVLNLFVTKATSFLFFVPLRAYRIQEWYPSEWRIHDKKYKLTKMFKFFQFSHGSIILNSHIYKYFYFRIITFALANRNSGLGTSIWNDMNHLKSKKLNFIIINLKIIKERWLDFCRQKLHISHKKGHVKKIIKTAFILYIF